jgi:dihydrolipoamide dehydrogenase
MGLEVDGRQRIDLATFQRWKNRLITTLGDGVRSSLHAAGVTIVTGRATFARERWLQVERPDAQPLVYEFADAVIATGSSPIPVPGLDLADPRVIDAAGLLALEHLPAQLMVVGAGYIGVELGTALAKLGVRVTLVEAGPEILPGLDSEAAREVHRRLADLGVQIHIGAEAHAIDGRGATITVDGDKLQVEAEYVLVAAGRRPNSELGLQHVGIARAETGHIQVGADLRASAHIAAIGDVVAGPGLAHKATAEARIAVAGLCGEKLAVDHVVPLVVFSDPEIAVVGLAGGNQARRSCGEVATVRQPIAKVGRSFIEQRSRGFVRLTYDPTTRRLLGAVLCGHRVTELAAEVTLAVEAGLTVDDLALTVHPHPTLSEAVWETAHAAT